MDNLAEKYSYEDLLNNVETDALDVDKEVETEDDTIVDSSESRKLYVDKVDKSTSDLFRMIVEGELNLQPNYQRKFVWDKKTLSGFKPAFFAEKRMRPSPRSTWAWPLSTRLSSSTISPRHSQKCSSSVSY